MQNAKNLNILKKYRNIPKIYLTKHLNKYI